MEVRKSDRRWKPGRQTLSHPEVDPAGGNGSSGAAGGESPATVHEDTRYDPVYDWFELRRRTKPPLLPRRP